MLLTKVTKKDFIPNKYLKSVKSAEKLQKCHHNESTDFTSCGNNNCLRL